MASATLDDSQVDSLNSTAKKVARLRSLAGKAGRNIYERCKLASEILRDKDYVAEKYGGYDEAQVTLEDSYFSDLKGFICLERLVAIVRHFEEEQQWRNERYNIRSLNYLFEESQKAPVPKSAHKTRRKSSKAENDALRDQLHAERTRSAELAKQVERSSAHEAACDAGSQPDASRQRPPIRIVHSHLVGLGPHGAKNAGFDIESDARIIAADIESKMNDAVFVAFMNLESVRRRRAELAARGLLSADAQDGDAK